MHPRVRYEWEQWKPRALRRAKSLVGEEWTEREMEVIEANKKAYPQDNGKWAAFMAFGVRPEMQSYIDITIELLEEEPERYKGQFLICAVRLKWSCEILIGGVEKY